jgi:putative Holliday junction resolvase
VRVLGVDYGAKRIGLALSDATATLARPWKMVPAAGGPRQAAESIARVIAELRQSDDPDLDRIVVGLPRRLNGDDTDQTPVVRRFVSILASLTALPIDTQDERLTSIEAESRLAAREPDWRKRKSLIDAEAASIVLQDYLDAGPRVSAAHRDAE